MLKKTPAEYLPPSLESLAIVLRDQSLWPRDFEWDFTSYHTCAIGLSVQIWGWDEAVRVMSSAGDLNRRHIFFAPKVKYLFGVIPIGYTRETVSPEDVARRIDGVLGEAVA